MVSIVQNLKGGRGTVSPKMGVWLKVSRQRLRVGVLGGDLKEKTVSCEPQNDFIFYLKKSF